MNRWFLALLILLAACSRAPQGGVTQAALKPEVDIQILTVSDWHAQLDPLVVGTAQVGGAAALSAYFKADRLANPNTLTLTAGDAYGASPPVSSFFNEVPAVQAMRLMGFNADTFGNHNFDKGTAFLQQLINIANAPAGGSQPGTPFQYVSANLLNRDANLSGVKDYQIFEVAGIKVAVIGITNPEAPTLVFPNSFGSIQFANTAAAANKARSNAAKEGAQVFIAITHMGVTNFDSAGAPVGPVIDFANSVGNFDLIVGDHTDVEYSGIINNALVVENRSKGLTYAKINLKVETKKGKVTARSSQFVTPLVSAVTPDPVIASLLNSYRTQLAPILSVVIGSSNRFVPRADACGTGNGRTCESLVGNITTDAMRTRYSTDFAITNSGGLRANLTCPTTDSPTDFCPAYTPPPFPISRGQVLGVLPFGNIVVTLQLNGAELKTMLENGVSRMPAIDGRFPQVSGLCFSYSIAAAAGSRVTGAVRQAADGSCTGAAVDLTAATTYTLAENDFMASGGDGYSVFSSRAATREIMDQVVADYITANSPIAPAIQGRIVCTTSGTPACPVVVP